MAEKSHSAERKEPKRTVVRIGKDGKVSVGETDIDRTKVKPASFKEWTRRKRPDGRMH